MTKHMAVFSVLAVCSLLGAAANAAPKPLTWIPTWYASPEPGWDATTSLDNHTIREIVHTTAGGKYVRIRLSNAYGTAPLTLDEVDIALRDTGSSIKPNSSAPVTFQGHGKVTIAPASSVLSDPIPVEIPTASDIAVSIFASGPAPESTIHLTQRSAVYASAGNVASQTSLPSVDPGGKQGSSWVWLDEVEVADSAAKAAVVAFGDSITDGAGPQPDTNAPWPDVLYSRLQAAKIDLAVINTGISGNRLLHEGSWAPFGIAGLGRYDSEVLAQPNVKSVIVLLGINDIGQVSDSGATATEYVSPSDIEDGLTQLAERAHEHHLKIYVGTLTPFKVTTIKNYYSDDKEVKRQAVNSWIRSQSVFDGVVDFDKAVDDPANPGHMIPAYDSGDHLHPSKDGDAAMAGAIPLGWFE